MDDLKLKEYVKFQIDRGIISLYKRYFEMIEDLHKDHLTLLEKVRDKTSDEFVKNIDYFDTNKYNYIRKKILDAGNDTIRTIDTNLKSVNVTLK